MILVSILNDTIPFHLFSFYISAFQHVTFDDLFLKSVSLIAVDIFSESSQSFNWFLVLFQHKNTILRLHYFKSKETNSLFCHSPSWFICWLDGLFCAKIPKPRMVYLHYYTPLNIYYYDVICPYSPFTVITIVLTLNFRNPSCIFISSKVEFDWPETHNEIDTSAFAIQI
jgi:hypothetical protein